MQTFTEGEEMMFLHYTKEVARKMVSRVTLHGRERQVAIEMLRRAFNENYYNSETTFMCVALEEAFQADEVEKERDELAAARKLINQMIMGYSTLLSYELAEHCDYLEMLRRRRQAVPVEERDANNYQPELWVAILGLL